MDFNQFTKSLLDIPKEITNHQNEVARKSLNETAEEAMQEVSKHIEKTYKTKGSKWYKVGAKYGLRKISAKNNNLAVTIFIPFKNGEHWIEDHERGDIRKPTKSNSIIIPTKQFLKANKLIGKSNRVIKKKASSILGNKLRNRIFTNKSQPDIIFQGGIKRGSGIFSRQKMRTKGSYSKFTYIPAFIIRKQVKQKATLEFDKTIKEVFIKNFVKNYNRRMKR